MTLIYKIVRNPISSVDWLFGYYSNYMSMYISYTLLKVGYEL